VSVERPLRTPLGRWTCRYYFLDDTGRRRSATADGATEAAARREAIKLREAARVRHARVKAGLEAPARPAVPAFADYVLLHHEALWPTTQNAQHRSAQVARLARYAVGVLGSTPVDQVTRADVRRVMAETLAAGMTPATANRVLAALSVVFRHAVDAGLRADNPAKGLQLRETGERTEMLELEEVAKIIELAPERWRAFFAAAFYTGARPSSLRSLRVQDIDLLRGTVHFPRWKARGSGRTVPIAAELQPLLRDHLRTRRGDGLDAYVWAQADGRAISETGYRKAWLSTLRAAGIERPVLFADLRASFATHLLGTGLSPDVARRALGHASLQTTQRYVRRSEARGDSQDRDAVNLLRLDRHSCT
jgi:integrase